MVSQEVNLFLSAKSSWFLKWGTYALLTVTVVLIIAGNLVKVPDFVSGEFKLQSIQSGHVSSITVHRYPLSKSGPHQLNLTGRLVLLGDRQKLICVGQRVNMRIEYRGQRYNIRGTIINLGDASFGDWVSVQVQLDERTPLGIKNVLLNNIGKSTKLVLQVGSAALLKIIFDDSMLRYKSFIG